jgi:hypothetical protein
MMMTETTTTIIYNLMSNIYINTNSRLVKIVETIILRSETELNINTLFIYIYKYTVLTSYNSNNTLFTRYKTNK